MFEAGMLTARTRENETRVTGSVNRDAPAKLKKMGFAWDTNYSPTSIV